MREVREDNGEERRIVELRRQQEYREIREG